MNQDEIILQRGRLLSRLLCLSHVKIIKIGIVLGLAAKEDINIPEDEFLKQFYKKLDETKSFDKLWEIMQQHKPDRINTMNPFK